MGYLTTLLPDRTIQPDQWRYRPAGYSVSTDGRFAASEQTGATGKIAQSATPSVAGPPKSGSVVQQTLSTRLERALRTLVAPAACFQYSVRTGFHTQGAVNVADVKFNSIQTQTELFADGRVGFTFQHQI